MKPLVSVIVPCHNAAPWLDNALASLLKQNIVNLELIAIDDGSTDATSLILAEAARRDPRVCLITLNENGGIVNALNTALDAATGLYIARMDADDIALPERLERQVEFIRRTGCDLCGTWFVEFGQGIPRKVCWPHGEAALSAAMLFQNTICHPTIMAKREVFEIFRYREEYTLAEDYDLFVRVGQRFRLDNLPEVLLRYRRHYAQATQAKRYEMESVAKSVRYAALQARGLTPSPEELHAHNSIRAPQSIMDPEHLAVVETWLIRLLECFDATEARKIVASQWIRACIRAAPLGHTMWHIFQSSPLCDVAGVDRMTRLDLFALSSLRLDYQSMSFNILRRFGLSA